MHITDPRAFRNCIASLFNLDRYDLQSGGVIEPGEAGNDDWYQLNENTARWVLHLDDARLAALWALIEARQRRSPALGDVANERRRQVESEGWSAEHDDNHIRGELAFAAGCYAVHAAVQANQRARGRSDEAIAEKAATADPGELWPFSTAWWKPRTARENLVRAAAMLLAEIERIDRSASAQ